MKKITHKINIILTILWMISSVFVILFTWNDEENMIIMAILGFLSLILSFIVLVYGSVIPDKDTYIPENNSKFVGIFVILNALLNKKITPVNSQEVLSGEKPIIRCWIPILYLIILLCEIPVFMMAFFTENTYLQYATAFMIIDILLLTISSSIWFVMYNKEIGVAKPLKKIVIQHIGVIAFFAISFIIPNILNKDDNNLSIDINKIQSDVDKAKQALENMDNSDLFYNKEYNNITDVFLMIGNNFENQKIYYNLQQFEENKVNVVVWTDTDENVYVFQFKTQGDKYIMEGMFQSEKIKKEDVQGKETGVLEQ